MARRERDDVDDADDDRDYIPPPPRQANHAGLIIGLMISGAVLVTILLCGVVGMFFWRFAQAVPAQPQVATAIDEQPVPVQPDMGAMKAIPPEGAKAPAARNKGKAATIYSRKDFEAKVRGKSRDEIIAAIGPPDETRERMPEYAKVTRPGGRDTGERIAFYYDWWVFKDRVLNDATGKPYLSVGVRFGDNGKADWIEYP